MKSEKYSQRIKEYNRSIETQSTHYTAQLVNQSPSKLSWVRTGSRKMRLEVRQRKTLERWHSLGQWGPSKVLRRLRLLLLKRKYAEFAWVAFPRCES